MESTTFPDDSSNIHMKYELENHSDEPDVQQFTGGNDLESQNETGHYPKLMLDESVSRAMSRRMTGVEEIYREASHLKEPMPTMGAGKPYPPMLPERDSYAVAFDGPDDPTFPQK